MKAEQPTKTEGSSQRRTGARTKSGQMKPGGTYGAKADINMGGAENDN